MRLRPRFDIAFVLVACAGCADTSAPEVEATSRALACNTLDFYESVHATDVATTKLSGDGLVFAFENRSTSQGNALTNVYRRSTIGGPATLLTETWAGAGYQMSDGGDRFVVYNPPVGSSGYNVVDASGSVLLNIPGSSDPVLSGNGEWVAYRRQLSNSGAPPVYAIHPAAPANGSFFANYEFRTSAPILALSDDGNRVVTAGNIYDRTLDLNVPLPASVAGFANGRWAFSGNGRYLFVWRESGGLYFLSRADLDTGVVFDVNFTANAATAQSPIAVSDDGRYVVTIAEEILSPEDHDNSTSVYILDADTREAAYLARYEPFGGLPDAYTISGDGTTVALTVLDPYFGGVPDYDGLTDVYIVANPLFCGGVLAENAVPGPLEVPTCDVVGPLCRATALVEGRASLGPENNAPNTLDGCADGTAGMFHSDESLDAISIATIDGSNLAPGKEVVVQVDTWAYASGVADYLDVYMARNAAAPVWELIGTLQGTGPEAQTYSMTFPLRAGGDTQAIRGQWRYGSGNNACASGVYNDRDDLAFAVAPPASWQNPIDIYDVNDDGAVTLDDANVVIAQIGLDGGSYPVWPPTPTDRPAPYVDVTGNGYVSALDALWVINEVANRQP